MWSLVTTIVKRILPIAERIFPLLKQKKLPWFSQTVSEFGKSKSNALGVVLVVVGGGVVLYFDLTSNLGYELVSFGLGMLALKDAIVKKEEGR